MSKPFPSEAASHLFTIRGQFKADRSEDIKMGNTLPELEWLVRGIPFSSVVKSTPTGLSYPTGGTKVAGHWVDTFVC